MLREKLRECTTDAQVVRLLSPLVRQATECCAIPLELVIDSEYRSFATECVGDRRRQHNIYLGETYVRLQTVDGCELSVVNLDLDDDTLEIISETVPSQQRKGYNALLRSVAVLVAHVQRATLVSNVENPLSAYTLLKTYQCTVVWRKHDNTDKGLQLFACPLSAEEARAAAARSIQVRVHPTMFNLDVALRQFEEAVILCADEEQVQMSVRVT